MDDWGLRKYEPHDQSKWECTIIMRIVSKMCGPNKIVISQNSNVERYLMMFDTLI